MATILQMDQRSDDWFAARCGRVTASRVADVIAKTKSGPSASRANYRAQLVCERLTGTTEASFVNAAMQWGVDNEASARDAYCFRQDVDVTEVGFVIHPALPLSGASPDGLVGEDGMVEIKCPNTATHIDTLLSGSVPDKYAVQMQWQMACTGRRWCDFVSFDPRLPEEMRLFVKRVHRDDDRIAELEREVGEFIEEINATVDRLKAAYSPANDDTAPNPLMAG
jgi:putative phage-type endonuclease